MESGWWHPDEKTATQLLITSGSKNHESFDRKKKEKNPKNCHENFESKF